MPLRYPAPNSCLTWQPLSQHPAHHRTFKALTPSSPSVSPFLFLGDLICPPASHLPCWAFLAWHLTMATPTCWLSTSTYMCHVLCPGLHPHHPMNLSQLNERRGYCCPCFIDGETSTCPGSLGYWMVGLGLQLGQSGTRAHDLGL